MLFLFQQREVRQQGRSRQALPCCRTGAGQILQHITLLSTQSEHDRQHPGNELATRRTLRSETGSPPNHGRAQGALRRVVGRLDTCYLHKQPEGLFDFEQRAAGPCGPCPSRFLSSRWLVSGTFGKPALDLSADLDHCRHKLQPRQSPIADTMPPLEQLAGLCEQSFTDSLRFSAAVGDLSKFANQMRPTQLPPIKRPPTVTRPPSRDQVASELTQQRFGRHLTTAQMDLKDRHPTRHQYPQPGFTPLRVAAIAVALHPAGLI